MIRKSFPTKVKADLFEKHSSFVASIAWEIIKKYQLTIEIFPELIQEGSIGLLESLKNYDLSKAELTTYSFPRIYGNMIKFLKRRNHIKIPDKEFKQLKEFKKKIMLVSKNILQKENIEPTLEDIITKVGWPHAEKKKMLELMLLSINPLSINLKLKDAEGGEEKELVDFIYSNIETPENICIQTEFRERVRESVERLPKVNAQILIMMFGLKDGKDYSEREIARSLNISRYMLRKMAIEGVRMLLTDPKFLSARTCL